MLLCQIKHLKASAVKEIILLIDDNAELRENTSELLQLAGYDVYVAENGKRGLEQLRQIRPNLILCDIMMPELDGYGVLRALNNIPELSGIPFVFLTAKIEKADFRNAMDLGADDYLMKPFSGDDLLKVVHARLKKSQKLTTAGPSDKTYLHCSDVECEYAVEAFKDQRAMKKIKNRDSVFQEGDTATHLYFVKTGKIKLHKTNEWGKEYITEIINEGEFFGYQALLNEHPRNHSATALMDSEIGIIPKQDFMQSIYSDKNLALHFICHLSEITTQAEEKSLHLAYDSARKRVAEALLYIYHQYNKKDDPDFEFDVTRENLSAIAGISPESVSRNLSDFRDEKLIVSEHGKLRITDFRKLAGLHG